QIFDFAYSPNGTGGSFGASLSRIGDVDNDGCEDFVAGEPDFAISNGLARVFSGKTHALIVDIAGNIGSGVGAPGDGKLDLDNDGFPDVLLGAPNDSTGASNAGAVLAFSPHKNAQIWFVSSTVSTAQFGAAVRTLQADLDGDNVDDLIIGAPGADSAFVYSG